MDPKVLSGEMLSEAVQENIVRTMDGILSDGVVLEGPDEHHTLKPHSDRVSQDSDHGGVNRKKSKVIFSVKKLHNGDS